MSPSTLLKLINRLISLLERYLDYRKQQTAQAKQKAHQEKLDRAAYRAIRRDPDSAWAERFGVRDGEGDGGRGDGAGDRNSG